MEFITGSYCNDTGGKGDIYSLKGNQEDKKTSNPSNPTNPSTEELKSLIEQPYEGIGANYVFRMGKDFWKKMQGDVLNINTNHFLKDNDAVRNAVKRATDFIPPRRDRNRKLKELSDRELWEIAFFMVRNLPNYGKESAEHFWVNSGAELVHHQPNKHVLTLGLFPRLLNAINDRVSQTIFTKEGIRIPSYPIDVTGIIKKHFPSLRMDHLGYKNIPTSISEMGVFGGIKEVRISGKLGEIPDYMDNSSQWYPKKQPYSLEIELKDWFGVDEDDVINMDKPAIIQRHQLAAFWLLQHQRGYQPFVNTLKYDGYPMIAYENKLNVF